MLARQLPHIGLGHSSERKQGTAELLLREAEKKVRLVLVRVSRPQQVEAAVALFDPGIVAGRHVVGAVR